MGIAKRLGGDRMGRQNLIVTFRKDRAFGQTRDQLPGPGAAPSSTWRPGVYLDRAGMVGRVGSTPIGRAGVLLFSSALKVSVVTAVYNRVATVGAAIDSVAAQSYGGVEHVVVDGGSDDGTDREVRRRAGSIATVIREPDDGIYDALNKGIGAATGDVVGFLHADDRLADDDAIADVAAGFDEPAVEAVYGDLIYVDGTDPSRVVRYWKAGRFDVAKFRRGWMPPHPTVYVRRDVYRRLGGYRLDVGSAADYECMVRLMVRHRINVRYVPRVVVRMRTGGESNASMGNRLRANANDRRAWVINEMRPPIGLRFTKPLSKVEQYFRKPPR